MKKDIKPFEKKVWLSSPTMHGDEIKYVEEAYTLKPLFFSFLLEYFHCDFYHYQFCML